MNSTLSTYTATASGTLYVVYGVVSGAGSYLGEPPRPALPFEVRFSVDAKQYFSQVSHGKYWNVQGTATAIIEGESFTVNYSHDGQDRHPSNNYYSLLAIEVELEKATGKRLMMSDPKDYNHSSWKWF
jgi:hypothetical protein